MQLSLIVIIFYLLKISAENNQTKICPSNLFQCDTHRCLSYAFVCNGEYNCHDQTDEINCSTALINNHLCNINISINCEQDILQSTRLIEHGIHYEYIRPIQICIKRSSVCDGIIDCRDGIDEQCAQQNPLITCSIDEYHCRITNRCIPKAWRCNGINDCQDPFSSDELNCSRIKPNCSTNEFTCQSKEQCISSMAVCDGFQDCADGSDESLSLCDFARSCTRDQFECKSTKLCIPKSNLCDTISQCHDRSDEMSCTCPIEDYVSDKLFYRCGLTNQCLPKDLECDIKRQCNPSYLTEDNDQCPPLIYRSCFRNNSCLEENQYCRTYPRKHCACQTGYRMNETTGMCEDINECRERVICDQYCINTLGSYRCACQENYQLKSDKHTCTLRMNGSSALYALFEQEIYQLNMNNEYELDKTKEIFITLTDHAYLIDHDPIDNYLYFAECSVPVRAVIMSCPKTRGIFRIDLNQLKPRKELIIDGRDYTSIQSLAVDWVHRNIYFVNTRLQTIDVCRLNGSFCRVLLHQTITDYSPQRIILYPEKGFLFYTAVVKSRAQHIVRLGMDGANLKLLFTIKTTNDVENVNYLRPLLTIDRINHYLYFYNGYDKIYVLNMHGDILHIQYQTNHRFHAFAVSADKMYKAFVDVGGSNQSEFRINPKYALGTTLLGPGLIFDIDRVVQTFYNKSAQLEEGSWSLNSLHNLYYLQYPIHMIDFVIVDPNDNRGQYIVPGNHCEQLYFPNAINQTEIICGCGQYYTIAADGHSCLSNCPQNFFECPFSKKCVPFYQHCDGLIDCIFGEDENNCQALSCQNISSFRCSSSEKCLTKENLCNNVTDCLLGEDEDNLICEHFCEWPSLNTCLEKYPNLCSDVEFYCDGKCVPITHRCDDKPYCYDGADEPFDCANVTCPHEYFKCPLSGKCIPYEKVCDNFEDCPLIDRINGVTADETSQACNFVLSQLSNLTTIAPPMHMTCESADLFRCKTSSFCINRTYVCDGDLDCSDSSDEENCSENHHGLISLLHKDYTCINGYRCARQRHERDNYDSLCIPLHELCDGINQCPLGDDEHQWRCRKCSEEFCLGNCSNCDSTSSFCELINRRPICQCKKGYMKVANGSCIFEDNLCNWSYGICSQMKLSQIHDESDLCMKKNSHINCQCDRGYEILKNNDDDSISCVVKANQTFDVMLNPRASFYLSQNDSIFAPINPSHHAIDVVLIPTDETWYILYTEQRNGHAFIWQQKFYATNQLQNNATPIWSSSLFQFTLIKADWIHRLVYVLYDDPSSSANGIEILYANKNDYTQLTFVNRLTFSSMKTISSIQVHPLQGYLYISAYYDAQHSFIYRSLLDGSNLELFLTLDYPVLNMVIDYRHPRLYILLSNGEIESYSIDTSQPWKTSIHHFKDLRPYAMNLHDNILGVMVFNATESIYDEIGVNKFGKFTTEKHRKLKTPTIVQYIHEFTYPMTHQVCSDSSCPSNRICISTPSSHPLCIIPGQMNLCGSSCHSRGICSNGECICSNQTYTGDDCEMCRLTDSIHVGCFHLNNDHHSSCMCYLTRSKARSTPYLCTTLKNDYGEIEVPCDRIISPMNREYCSQTIFPEPLCEGPIYSLIFHVQTQSCICRETMNRKINCLNNGLWLVNDNDSSSTCQCSFPFSGNQCELNRCKNHCQNNGSCSINGTSMSCSCSSGFTGERCEYSVCQSIKCSNKEQCFIENNQPICRRPGRNLRHSSWLFVLLICFILSIIGYVFLRYNLKWIRLKYLFAHHRLHEQIGLEINSIHAAYSHIPTSELNGHDRPLEDVLFDENEMITTSTMRNNRTEELIDDPFYIDEKQPIFSHDRTSNRPIRTGIL